MCKQSQKTHLLWFEKILFNEPVGTNRESTTRFVLLFQLGASGKNQYKHPNIQIGILLFRPHSKSSATTQDSAKS